MWTEEQQRCKILFQCFSFWPRRSVIKMNHSKNFTPIIPLIYVKGNQSFVRYNISSESRFTSNTKVNVKQNNLIWSLNQTWFNDIAPIIIKNPRLFLFLRPELRKTWACAVCMCVQSLIWIIPNWNFFSLDQADFPCCMLYERIYDCIAATDTDS